MEAVTILQQALAVLSGALVGFRLGLIGGGSILAVPLLLYVVGYHNPHTALGTTAAAVAATAFVNVIPHWRARHLRWNPGRIFALVGAVGAAGAALGKSMPGRQLLFLFALLMIFVALTMLRSALWKLGVKAVDGEQPKARAERSGMGALARTGPVALAASGLSGFFGIGGRS